MITPETLNGILDLVKEYHRYIGELSHTIEKLKEVGGDYTHLQKQLSELLKLVEVKHTEEHRLLEYKFPYFSKDGGYLLTITLTEEPISMTITGYEVQLKELTGVGGSIPNLRLPNKLQRKVKEIIEQLNITYDS